MPETSTKPLHWATANPQLAEEALTLRRDGVNAGEIIRLLNLPVSPHQFRKWAVRRGGYVYGEYTTWTDELDRTLRDRYAQGWYNAQIAAEIGATESAVRTRVTQLGLTKTIRRASRRGEAAAKWKAAVRRKPSVSSSESIALVTAELRAQNLACENHLKAIEAEGIGCFPFHCEGQPRWVNARIGSRTVRARHYPLEEVTW